MPQQKTFREKKNYQILFKIKGSHSKRLWGGGGGVLTVKKQCKKYVTQNTSVCIFPFLLASLADG